MIDREAIIAEIVSMTNPAPQQPDEFTIAEYMEQGGANCTDVARRRLNKLVDGGVLARRMTEVNGRRTLVYRRLRSC